MLYAVRDGHIAVKSLEPTNSLRACNVYKISAVRNRQGFGRYACNVTMGVQGDILNYSVATVVNRCLC